MIQVKWFSMSAIALSSILNSSVLVAAEPLLVEKMTCKKVFGNPIFSELSFTFTSETEGVDWASRKVDIKVDYVHSDLDSNYYTLPITLSTDTYTAMHTHMLEIGFDDSTFGDNDYSGGKITFQGDDLLGNLAVIEYGSDGANYYGVLSCDQWPKFGN